MTDLEKIIDYLNNQNTGSKGEIYLGINSYSQTVIDRLIC